MSRRRLQLIARAVQVTTYLDYRDYLQDLYQRAKDSAKEDATPYSYSTFAEELGFSATNVIWLVINRNRVLADKSAQTIVRCLDLRKEDRKYFLAMVKHINSRGAGQRDKHFHKMLDAKQASIVADSDRNRMEFYSEWYYPIVRELARLGDFQSDPAWMAKRLYPNVSADKIQRAIDLLASIGLVRVGKSGQVKVAEQAPMLMPEDAAAGHLSITQYHQSMIEVAKEAVTKVPVDQRDVNALTVTVSYEMFKELRERARTFCAEVVAMDDKPQERQCVVQLNLQVFAMTKPDDSDQEKGS